jgi:hypothetical protein
MTKPVRTLLVATVLCVVSSAKAQSFSIGLLADYSTLTHREMKTLGFTGEIYLRKDRRFALNYNVRLGETYFFNYKNSFNQPVNGRGFNYKLTPGLVIAYWMIKNYNNWGGGKDDWKLLLGALLVPEGFTYYTDIKTRYTGGRYTHFKTRRATGHRIGIYCNPISCEGWNLNSQNQRESALCLESGLKGDFVFAKHFSFKPYIGFKVQYNRVFVGLNSGFSINYNFNRLVK